MSDPLTITLCPRRQESLPDRHPWVLEKSILPPRPVPADGDVVDLITADGKWVARGIYNGQSRIRLRLYSWDRGQSLDRDFWRNRLAAAVELRRLLGYDDPAGACRLVFSEADGLSGLIVDRYGEHLVVQTTALAMAHRVGEIGDLLGEILSPRGITVRTDRKIAAMEGMETQEAVLRGEPLPPSVTLRENGLSFQVDLGAGQKTGYYLDQRENRLAAAACLAGRRVLDMFCYVGGFSLAAAKLGGAREVLAFDSSQRAVEQARANAALNGVQNVRFEVAEAFETLESLASAGERFGAVILDPPRFAGTRQSIDHALRAYHRLNRLGVQLLEPGGILVTCSCSGRVSRDDFSRMLYGVVRRTRREIQILQQRGPSPDHPVRPSCPETDYLKCFICRVE